MGILPLAHAAVTAAKVVNVGMQVGRMFGFPTPVVSSSTLNSASDYVDTLGASSTAAFARFDALINGKHAGTFTDMELSLENSLAFLIP